MTSPPRLDETIIALAPRACLDEILAAVHAAGLGGRVSVVDPVRGDVEGRLRRLGITSIARIPRTDGDSVLVVVPAPGRVAATASLLRARGALAIEQCGRLPAREHAWFGALFGGVDSPGAASAE